MATQRTIEQAFMRGVRSITDSVIWADSDQPVK